MLRSVASATRAVQRNTRAFSVAPARLNLISDLYVKELKAFKPAQASAADAESATKPWKLPAAAKAPVLEAEGSDALAEYDSSVVETATDGAAGVVEEYNPDAWFVFPEEEVVHH